MAKSERNLTEDQVRQDHLAAVHQPAQWAYLFGVLIGGTVLMLLLIAAISSGG